MNGLLLIFLQYKLQSSYKYLWVQFTLWATIPCLLLWSAEIQALKPTIYLSQYLWGTHCGYKLLHSHIHPSCLPELQGEQEGRHTLLISDTSLVPCICWGKAGTSCSKAVQIESQPTHLPALLQVTSHVLFWLIQVEKVNKEAACAAWIHKMKNKRIERKEAPAQHWQSTNT